MTPDQWTYAFFSAAVLVGIVGLALIWRAGCKSNPDEPPIWWCPVCEIEIDDEVHGPANHDGEGPFCDRCESMVEMNHKWRQMDVAARNGGQTVSDTKKFSFRVGVVAADDWYSGRAGIFQAEIGYALKSIEEAAIAGSGLVEFTLRLEVSGTVEGTSLSAPLVVSNVREALRRVGVEEFEPAFAPVRAARKTKEVSDGE